MNIDEQKTMDVARLSSLALRPDEIPVFTEQISSVLTYVEQLNKLDTSSIEPTSHVTPLANVYRNDHVSPSLPVKEVMESAPESRAPYFRVPKIIE